MVSDHFFRELAVIKVQLEKLREEMPPIQIGDVFGRFVKKTLIKFDKDIGDILEVWDLPEFNQVKIPQGLIKSMDRATKACVKKHPELMDHPYLCENVYWTPMQDRNSYTLHTHTIPTVDYPSQADINTTKKLKKKNLCIINTSDRSLSCYKDKDNFHKKSVDRRI